MTDIPWIECGLTWDAFEKQQGGRASDALIGLQVEVDGETFLIGSINRLRGVCDDCEAFRGDAIVTRYRRLVEIP